MSAKSVHRCCCFSTVTVLLWECSQTNWRYISSICTMHFRPVSLWFLPSWLMELVCPLLNLQVHTSSMPLQILESLSSEKSFMLGLEPLTFGIQSQRSHHSSMEWALTMYLIQKIAITKIKKRLNYGNFSFLFNSYQSFVKKLVFWSNLREKLQSANF